MYTYLELGLAHGAVQSVLERLILKVEFDVILIRAISDRDIEVHFDGTLGDRSKFVRLGEFDIVPTIG